MWHVSVSEARLGALGEAALDARRLRTLVLVASRLHTLEPGSLAYVHSHIHTHACAHFSPSSVRLNDF